MSPRCRKKAAADIKNLCASLGKKISENKYQIGSSIVSVGISGASIVLYITTTSGTEITTQLSSIGANALINLLAGKVSLDHFRNIVKDPDKSSCKKFWEVFVKLVLAGAAAFPLALISVMQAQKKGASFGAQLFNGISTGLANAALNGLAVEQLAGLAPPVAHFFKETWRLIHCRAKSKTQLQKEQVISTLKQCLEDLKHGDIDKLGTTGLRSDSDFSAALRAALKLKISDRQESAPDTTTFKNSIDAAEELAQSSTKTSCHSSSFWSSGCGKFLSGAGYCAKISAGLTAALAVIFGNFGYACDTQADMEKIGVDSTWGSVLCANLTQAFTYILNFKAGFSITTSIIDSIVNLFKYHCFENETRLGGVLGKIYSAIAPFFAAFLAIRSGFTGAKLFQEDCIDDPSVWFPKFFEFPGSDTFVQWSTVAFNTIWVFTTLCALKKAALERWGGDNTKLYLKLQDFMATLIEKIKGMSDEVFDQFMSNLPPDIQKSLSRYSSEMEPLIITPARDEPGAATTAARATAF